LRIGRFGAGAGYDDRQLSRVQIRDDINRAEEFRRYADREATEELVAKIILNGECIWLRAGTPLQAVGSAENPLYVIVSPIGETVTFVTYRRFLKK
jgi:hypothetical protein